MQGTHVDVNEAVKRLLLFLGENPDREGLKDTPKRYISAMQELTRGYKMNPREILSKRFECTSDEMVVVRGVEFQSLCEHHILPFIGTADIGYLPNGESVVGLSKLARLVDVFALRFQIQERMTNQIAEAMSLHVSPDVAVIVRAKHYCMCHRGVRKASADMVTSSMLGAFRESSDARTEFLRLVN